jgi:hypothetical protein
MIIPLWALDSSLHAGIMGSWEGDTDLRCESLPKGVGFQLQLKTVHRSKDFLVGMRAGFALGIVPKG